MGVRLYNPTVGRFLQTDPIVGGSNNQYEYARANPLSFVDLTGMNTCEVGLNPLRWVGNAIDCIAKVGRNFAYGASFVGFVIIAFVLGPALNYMVQRGNYFILWAVHNPASFLWRWVERMAFFFYSFGRTLLSVIWEASYLLRVFVCYRFRYCFGV
jgi:hypothetical protein